MTISKEAIEAAKSAYWHEAHNGGGYSDKCYEAALTAALPFLPIAVEGKVEELEDLRLAAASIREWMPETLPSDEQGKVNFARALAESAAETIELADKLSVCRKAAFLRAKAEETRT